MTTQAARGVYRLFTDGASRGNPGPAGAGVVLYGPGGEIIARARSFLGRRTCNYAEYTAVVRGLLVAKALRTPRIEVCCDSELLVRQVNGVYRVNEPTLKMLHESILSKKTAFESCTFVHVPRERNAIADLLANNAIDDRRKHFLEIEPGFWNACVRQRLGVHAATTQRDPGDALFAEIRSDVKVGEME